MGHSRSNVINLPAIYTRVRVGDVGKGRKGHERQKERRQQTMLDARGVKCKSGVPEVNASNLLKGTRRN
jgi:hypothetical protein